MTGPREDILLQTTNTLLDARRTNHPIPDLPPNLIPLDLSEVAFVQDAVAAAFGPIGGYKIGAPPPPPPPPRGRPGRARTPSAGSATPAGGAARPGHAAGRAAAGSSPRGCGRG